MTQAQLSEHSGLFRTHLSRIECGTANPSLDAIVAIACALRISPHDLLAHEAMELPGDSAR